MMTPQEVAASTFPKATLGGYNMAAVDVFLDKLTDDYTELYKENAALKAKMKVLVDKMEEYHAMEDTMRSTLLTAQKMASSMISEAEEKRAAMQTEAEEKRAELLSAAEADARVRMRELAADVAAEERRLAAVHEDIDRQIAQEQERLVVAQRELAAFIAGANALCTRQMELLGRLGELNILPEGFKMTEVPASVPEEVVADTCPEQEAAPEQATEQPEDAQVEEPAVEQEPAAEPSSEAAAQVESMLSIINAFVTGEAELAEKEADSPFEVDFDDADKLFDENADKNDDKDIGDPFAQSGDEDYDNFDDGEQDSTRVIKLNDLQFGRNYNKD